MKKLELFDFAIPPNVERVDTREFNDEPTLTRQEFSEECDINEIMARYEKTGVVSHVTPREPMYLDFNSVPSDLMGVMAQLKIAEDSFMTLPAKVRREFDNNAVNFVDFASDPVNLDQMREWGLAPPAVAPAELKPVPPPAPPAPPAPPPPKVDTVA